MDTTSSDAQTPASNLVFEDHLMRHERPGDDDGDDVLTERATNRARRATEKATAAGDRGDHDDDDDHHHQLHPTLRAIEAEVHDFLMALNPRWRFVGI